MDPKDIQAGHKISIIVEKLDFSSEIKHVRDGYILIELIVVNEKIVNFPDNVNANMVYFDDDDKLYSWNNVQIVPVKVKDGRKYHKITMPVEEGKKYNRRRHYRLYIGEEMLVDIKNTADKKSIMPIIRDASASGFSFIYKEELKVGQRVVLYFQQPEGYRRIAFNGKVVRVQYNENLDSNMYGCTIFDPGGALGKIINTIQQRKLNENRR